MGPPKAEGTRVGEANELLLGPWGEDYRRGAAVGRDSLAAARRTAMLRGLLLLLRETAAERTAASTDQTIAERNCSGTGLL